MAFAQADPVRYKVQLVEQCHLAGAGPDPAGRPRPLAGSWCYDELKGTQGDNSNTQYALLGLHAANEAGIPVKPEVWSLAQKYWETAQRRGGFDNGAWGYLPERPQPATGSMTCAGISSLVITGMKRYQGLEVLVGDEIRNCGKGGINPDLQRGIDWLSSHFRVGENFGKGQLWKYYYLYGLERAGRLSGLRYFGDHDWYFEGAEELIHDNNRDRLSGKWTGSQSAETDPVVTTSFVLLFLAKGRAPVLINKARHGPGADWNNDRDDIRNLAGVVSRDWKHLLTWQVVDPETSRVEDLLQAPILFFNGHEAPEFGPIGAQRLREYVEQGGLIFAEACCSEPEFDQGFRRLMKEVFPEPEYDLHPLSADHAVWRAQHAADPGDPPALGHRARLPNRRDLHARGPLLLLEPDGISAGQPRGHQGDPRRAERRRLRHRARAARRQALGPRRNQVRGREPASWAPCSSPSCDTPVSGTSPRWRFPT